jgi:hypothetical protein
VALAGLLRFVDDLPTPQDDPDGVRERAEEILSRPEYDEPPKSIWDRIGEWLGDQISRLFESIGLGGGGAGTVIAWLLLAALAAGVAWLIVRAVQSGVWGQGAGRGNEGDPVIVETEADRTPSDWLAEAARHEAAGRWSEALLCRYRALVTELVKRSVIPELIDRTSGEYVQDVRQRAPGIAASFTAATRLFEAAWYGGEPTGPEERDQFVGLARQVLEPKAIGAER